MPRSRKAAALGPASDPAPAGHNNDGKLTDDEASALTTYWSLKILADQKVLALKQAAVDDARTVVNGHFKMVSKDLGFTRKEFEAEVISKLGMNDAEYRNSEARRSRLHRLAGLKTGEQIDLLNHVLADTVDEAIAAEHDGYRAGRRADDPVPPSTVSPILHPDWMRGYGTGQEFNGLQLAKASEIMARPKPGEMGAAPADEPEEDDADPEVIKRKAKALKASGWTEPTPDEQQFEATDEELAAQSARQAVVGAREGAEPEQATA